MRPRLRVHWAWPSVVGGTRSVVLHTSLLYSRCNRRRSRPHSHLVDKKYYYNVSEMFYCIIYRMFTKRASLFFCCDGKLLNISSCSGRIGIEYYTLTKTRPVPSISLCDLGPRYLAGLFSQHWLTSPVQWVGCERSSPPIISCWVID